MAKRLLRTARWTITVLFVLDLVAIAYLDNLYVHHRPLKPTGAFTVEHPSHGTSTFIAVRENQLYILAWIVPFVLLGIGGILYQFERSDWRSVTEL